jgi:hypothetical protein
MKIVKFKDMHSGGRNKESYAYIYIEAMGEDTASLIFYNRFGHNPNRVTCTCCGEDYSIDEHNDLLLATAYERGCKYDETLCAYVECPDVDKSWRPYESLSKYLNREDVLFICDEDVKSEERCGELPKQGYV